MRLFCRYGILMVMTQDQKNIDIIGNWDVYIQTPFGVAKATALIKDTSPFIIGTVNGENGSFDFSNGVMTENILSFSATVETPIKATLTVQVTVEGDNFAGDLMVDQYLRVSIRGTKNVDI